MIDRIRFWLRAGRQWCERRGILPVRSFGLEDLDLKLLRYVDKRDGVFIEAGANDGLTQSNTAYLERYRGWRGLLVEPIPELAARCRRNRPRSIVEQCALVPLGREGGVADMTYCNLMSIVSGARGSSDADREHVQRGQKFLAESDVVRSVQVPTACLDTLLARHGIAQVDLLSLDVEGFEPQALAGLDLDRIAPTWILVEANDVSAVEAVIRPRYEFVAQLSHHDRLYRVAK